MIKGLIFDFDGLILETEGPDFQAWQELYQEHGHRLTLAAWAPCIGTSTKAADPLDRLEALVGHPLDRKAILSKRYQRYVELALSQPVLPGVRELIADARKRGLKLAVASSSQRYWVAGHLDRLGLAPYFDAVKAADDVARIKPAPDLYLAALAALSLAAKQAIALEDSPNGVTAAQKAGLFCVAVPNHITSQLSLPPADLLLDSLAAMPLEELLLEVQRRRRG